MCGLNDGFQHVTMIINCSISSPVRIFGAEVQKNIVRVKS